MTSMHIDVIFPREAEDTMKVRMKAEVDLSKLPENVKRPIITALHRGHTTALTGKPVWHYNALAHVFDFPVFQLGRTDRCILSYRKSQSQAWVEGLVADLKNMWKLSIPSDQIRHSWFHSWTYDGHNDEWMQLVVTRPQKLTMDSICTFMGVGTIQELVPIERRMAALLAVEQGQVIDVSRFVRGVPK